jgi:hypothetical protein
MQMMTLATAITFHSSSKYRFQYSWTNLFLSYPTDTALTGNRYLIRTTGYTKTGEYVVDFFEMDRVLDELARTFAAPSATTWFKVTGNKSPTRDEYRLKVAEFMNLFENSLSTGYRDYPNSKELLDLVRKRVKDQIDEILLGKDREVEKRFKYYVDHG